MLWIVLTTLSFYVAPFAAAAQDDVCRDPGNMCAEKLSSECLARVGAGLVGSMPAAPECAAEFRAYRSCVAAAANCESEAASSGPSGPVDPRLVGVWRMLSLTSSGKLSSWTLKIGADGAYMFAVDDPSLKNAVGVIRAAEGRWSIKTRDFEDGGEYRMPDENTVVFVGKTGPQMWTRSDGKR